MAAHGTRRGNCDIAKSQREGIMLSGEDFIIKRAASIKASDAREVISHVAPATFAGLIDHARRVRMTPSTLAAEFIAEGVASAKKSLRGVKGAPADDDLAEQLEAAHEKIAALKDKLTHEENARALRFAQKEAAEKRVSALEQELREERALRVGAIERMNSAETARDEARAVAKGFQNELQQQRDEIEARARPLPPLFIVTRTECQPVTIADCHPDTFRSTLSPGFTIEFEQPVQPEAREALAAVADAAVSHLRSIRALKAAGNSAAEIAGALGLSIDQVKQSLKGVK